MCDQEPEDAGFTVRAVLYDPQVSGPGGSRELSGKVWAGDRCMALSECCGVVGSTPVYGLQFEANDIPGLMAACASLNSTRLRMMRA